MKLAQTEESWRAFIETRQLLEEGKLAEARAVLAAQEGRFLDLKSPEEEAEGALLWSWVLYRENAYAGAIAKARQAYGGFRLTSNHVGAAESLYLLGLLFALTGELREAEKSLSDALANYRRASDQKGIAQTYSELARLAFIRSDLKTAEEYLFESLEAARAAADSLGEGRAWGNLGRVQFMSGRWEEAEKSLRLAMLVNRVIDARASLARNHLSLAYLYGHQGRQAEMEREFSSARGIIQTENLRREEAIYHEYRGEAYFWQKDWIKAEEEYRRALAIGQKLAPQSGLVTQVQRRWAELLLAQGRPGEAALRAEEALGLAQVLSEKEEILAALRVLAEAWTETNQPEKARTALEQALALLPSLSLPVEEARVKILAARLLPSAEEDRAQKYLEEAAAFLARMKAAPVFGEPLFRTAEKLLEAKRILLLEKILEILEHFDPILFFAGEERSRRVSLSSRMAESKISFAYSPENRYALFLNLSRAESLEAKLLLLVREMQAEGAALFGLSDGHKELASVGELPDGVFGANGDETAGPKLEVLSKESLLSFLSLPLMVEGEKAGVLYLSKRARPFSQEELNLAAAAASHFALELSHLTKKNLARENERLLATLEEKCAFPNIITRSPLLFSTIEAAARVKDSDLSILLLGETGVGKDLLAKTIHFQSNRREHRFVSVNCAALPETLLESELFGHRRGAFTGADRDKPGLFEEADGGTFFLDEVTEIPLSVQAKLLRVLEEKEMVRLGETRPRKVNVRLISAGNKDLKALTEKGLFRQDLFYRLSAFTVKLPSLRERKEDIPLLLEHFAAKYAGGKKLRFNPAAFELLSAYDWPGNVRELENEVRKLAVMADESGLVTPELLSAKFFGSEDEKLPSCHLPAFSLYEFIAEAEKKHIQRALLEAGGVKKRAAELLKIPESTLRLKLKEYGNQPPDER